jgi:hypothetical protein
VRDGIDEDLFVAMCEARDRALEMPMLLPSIQVNVRGVLCRHPGITAFRISKYR